MQLSAVLNIFIVKTSLNSIFTNDLKITFFFGKMFIVTDLVSLSVKEKLTICVILISNFGQKVKNHVSKIC